LSRTTVHLALLGLAILPACHRHRHETAATAEGAVLERRRQGLASLVAAARRGTLLPFDKVLVVADDRLVRQVIAASLPVERVIGDRYRIRVTGAEVRFEDGFALVRLEGEATFADRPATEGRAELTIYGGLDVVDLDPDSGVLRGGVKVIAVDARRVDVFGVRSFLAEDLVENLGREKLDAFSALASRIEIPVRLERSVTLPAVGPGEVRIDAATIPLRVAVADVKAFRGKLWVSVDVSTETGAPAPVMPSPEATSSSGGDRSR
jgi:hypothetical protein